jgi:AcrR family transcriptional regulator
MDAPQARSQQSRRAQTRARLLTSATTLFGDRGYHNTHVTEIVNHARVSTGTFYKYFEDKRAIYRALVEEISSDLRRQIQVIRRQALTVPREELAPAIEGAFEAFFVEILRQRDLYQIVLRGGFGVDEETDGLVWTTVESFASDIAEDLNRAVALGLLQPIDCNSVARMITGQCFHTAQAMLVNNAPTPAEAAVLASRFVLGGLLSLASDAFWSGLSVTQVRELVGLQAPSQQQQGVQRDK